MHSMTTPKYWTEILRCPDCASTAIARLAQKNDQLEVESIPADFIAVTSEYGDTFYCKTCNRPATTSIK